MSQEEATKPGRAFISRVCLEIVIPFPASALLETVLGSEGSAGVLLEKQRTKMGFLMAQAIPSSSTYIKFSYTSALYKAQLPSHRSKGAPFCSLDYQAASAHTIVALSCPSPRQDSAAWQLQAEVQTNKNTCLAENLSRAPRCAHKPVQQPSCLLVS